MKNIIILILAMCITTVDLFSQATEHQVLHTPNFGDFFPPALPSISTLFPTTDANGLPWFAAGDAVTTTTTSNFGTAGINFSSTISDQVIIEHVLNFSGHTNLQFRLTSQSSTTWKVSYLYLDLDADPNSATLVASLQSGAVTSTPTSTFTPNASGELYIRFYFSDDANSGDGQVQWKSDTQSWINLTLGSLPVEFVSFTGRLVENTVRLDWQTASETNNDYFIVERSNDQKSWEALSKVEGAGNSTDLLNYFFVDETPLLGNAYYRIKQVDQNERYTYSDIKNISIKQLENSSIIIYPNPSSDQISIIGNQAALNQIRIYNVLGQEVTFLTNIEEEELTKSRINLSSLKAGSYFIKTGSTIHKIYKQ